MRFDKLTTKFQQALADAQSLAARNDHPYIEPVHVLSAVSYTHLLVSRMVAYTSSEMKMTPAR